MCVKCGHVCTHKAHFPFSPRSVVSHAEGVGVWVWRLHARHSCSVFTALWCGCSFVKLAYYLHHPPHPGFGLSAQRYTAKSYVLNQTWLGSDTDLFTFRYRCAVIRCNTTFWQLSDSKSKYMSDSKCNRMCNSSVD